MSGAASIAAAKNRRSKETPRFVQSCPAKSGAACPLNAKPTNNNSQKTNNDNNAVNKMVDPATLRVLGPMQPLQIIQIHEQRLNNFDKKIEELKNMTPVLNEVNTQPQLFSMEQFNNACNTGACNTEACNTDTGMCNEACLTKFADLEEKIAILEEVVMNLQLTLANVQNFAMETNLCMMKLNNTVAPAENTAAPAPAPAENMVADHVIIKINELNDTNINDTTLLTEVFSPPLD